MKDAVHQGGFTVVNVGDNGDVPDIHDVYPAPEGFILRVQRYDKAPGETNAGKTSQGVHNGGETDQLDFFKPLIDNKLNNIGLSARDLVF
jgi:hypothetical protein